MNEFIKNYSSSEISTEFESNQSFQQFNDDLVTKSKIINNLEVVKTGYANGAGRSHCRPTCEHIGSVDPSGVRQSCP